MSDRRERPTSGRPERTERSDSDRPEGPTARAERAARRAAVNEVEYNAWLKRYRDEMEIARRMKLREIMRQALECDMR